MRSYLSVLGIRLSPSLFFFFFGTLHLQWIHSLCFRNFLVAVQRTLSDFNNFVVTVQTQFFLLYCCKFVVILLVLLKPTVKMCERKSKAENHFLWQWSKALFLNTLKVFKYVLNTSLASAVPLPIHHVGQQKGRECDMRQKSEKCVTKSVL